VGNAIIILQEANIGGKRNLDLGDIKLGDADSKDHNIATMRVGAPFI
jgi:hypothetical protein